MRGITLVLLLGMLTAGCTNPATTTPPPAAVAPGYLNPTDQQMGEALSAARAFYTTIQTDITAGKYTPSATEKTALNAFAVAINTAEAAYIAYHASPSVVTEDAASRAVQAVQQQQTALEPTIPGVSALSRPSDDQIAKGDFHCKAGWTKTEGGCTMQTSDGCNTTTWTDNGFGTYGISTAVACRETDSALLQGVK